MHLSIITGASRGLGQALAAQLLARGHCVLALARQPVSLSVPPGAELLPWAVDLSDALPVAQRLLQWLQQQDVGRVQTATLINNAALMAQPAPLGQVPLAELVAAGRVGLEAPTLLTAVFLQATAHWAATRQVVLVSSGLGRRGMAGSASYCAVKAGLDNLARAVALEEAAKPNGARIVSLAPGIIDTDMQVQLRGADDSQFPEAQRFRSIQAAGGLDTPATAAAKVLAYMARTDFGSQPVADVRDPAPAISR